MEANSQHRNYFLQLRTTKFSKIIEHCVFHVWVEFTLGRTHPYPEVEHNTVSLRAQSIELPIDKELTKFVETRKVYQRQPVSAMNCKFSGWTVTPTLSTGSTQKNCAHFEESMKLCMGKL